jgi:predicted ATPase
MKIMELNGLNEYVTIRGGANTFLFQGEETTKKIGIKLNFDNQDCDHYAFTFSKTVNDIFSQTSNIPFTNNKQMLSSNLLKIEDHWDPKECADLFLNETIKNWRIYQFQNTSTFSPLRQKASIYNNKELLDDGANLSAILWTLKNKEKKIYDKITSDVKDIMPNFDEFVLEPEPNKILDDVFIRLCWHQKGSTYLFQPWQMSDGTLRFIALAVALSQPNPPATIIIDEPEMSLHPESLYILSTFIHEASFESQLILTTQSLDLLNTMELEDIITVNMQNGESIFEHLDRSEFVGWLDNYSVGELLWKKVIQAGPTSA